MKSESGLAPVPENQKCVHGCRITIISFLNNEAKFQLGEDIARCPYLANPRFDGFNPFDMQTVKTICNGTCKVMRQNKMVEKLAYERVKIYTKAQVALTVKQEKENQKSIDDATKGS